jgi:hypothetical protein
MSVKFQGSYVELQMCVARAGYSGDWRELSNGHRQYRTDDGAILNYWESSGTVTFQGRDQNRSFEQAVIAAAKAQHRLVDANSGSRREPPDQGSLQRRIERAQAEIAELEWRMLKNESPLQNLMADKLEAAAHVIKALRAGV